MLEAMQKGQDLAYYSNVYLYKNNIQAYTSSFFNIFDTFIINYEAVYKLIQQSSLNKIEDCKLYPMEC